jgi:hypothetical protein
VSRWIRLLVVALLALPGTAGCGPSRSEGQPNPDLKVPDVPAGGRGNKGDMSKPDTKKEKK